MLKKFFFVAVLLPFVSFSFHLQAQNALKLEQGFRTPPDSVKLSIYWYWLNDNISKEGVEKDLDAMVKSGIGRAYIGNIGLPPEQGTAYGKVKLFSDEWWDITKDAISHATKAGIDLGIFNGPGWSQSGGPWIKPSQSMRYLANYQFNVTGPQNFSQKLPDTIKNFQDVAVIAFPKPATGTLFSSLNPKITASPAISNINNLIDGNTSTEAILPASGDKVSIDISVDSMFSASSLVIYPGMRNFRAHCELLAADDAGNYSVVSDFIYDRSNSSIQVGFVPYSPVLISFKPVKATHFRLVFTNVEGNGSIAEIKLLSSPGLERYMEKQLAKMFPAPQALWGEYQWKDQPDQLNKNAEVDPAKVLNISQYLSADGTLNWSVPKGNWVIMRLGMVPTGVKNEPASPEGEGLEVDKMNKTPIEAHFDAFLGKIQASLPPQERKSFKYVVADSYETGGQNWTDGFAAEFKKEYGYDPLPWLPVLNGNIVGSVTQSNRFLWDLRRQIANDIAYNYVGGLREVAHKHGLKLWLENYGSWGFPAEFLQYGGQSDQLSGEFWAEGSLGTIELKAASSAVHTYGKDKVFAESFTAGGAPFVRYPGMIKKKGDWAFTEGVNKTLLHVCITQPYEDKNPGVNAWFGTEFNRKNTWFEQGKAFFDYLRRCNFMLQQGQPVEDVAYFIGEDAPKMTGIRDPELPPGYSFDYINSEVIETRLSTANGRLVLPNGISYNILVLPKLETMRPGLLSKIKDLVAGGAVILGPPPSRSPSLQNYPEADNQIKSMAAEMWGNTGNKVVQYGKGYILTGMDMQQALDFVKTRADFYTGKKDTLLFVHRKAPGMDIYFVSNQSDKMMTASANFRVSGGQPQLFDAVDGTSRMLPQYTKTDTGTIVPLKLYPSQSEFIIFRNAAGAKKLSAASVNFPNAKIISELKGAWMVQFDPKWGPEKPVRFDTLTDWTKRPEDNIKYFSGTAVYHKSFRMGKIPAGRRIYLDLSSLKCMGKVKVNGIDLGDAWTPPYRVDITRAVKAGNNTLQVDVVNTWVNRLIGDSRLPKEQRKTWTDVDPYTPSSPLEPSGLTGPVYIESIKY
jgi:hypothetical protein